MIDTTWLVVTVMTYFKINFKYNGSMMKFNILGTHVADRCN